MARNVDWLTITPDKETYTEADNEIQVSYTQNTTPSTRLAEFQFFNQVAEDKHDYNQDSPDGMIDFYIYQFGKRSANLSLVANNMCNPSVVTCTPPTTLFTNSNIADTKLPPYTDTQSHNIDFTLTNSGNPNVDGAATEYQQNAEQKFRNYFVSNDQAVRYNLTLTVESTSPWYLTGGDFWTGIGTEYFRAFGSTDWARPRTYDADDNLNTETVTIEIGANNTTNSRSTTITLVNRQGIERNITLNQYEYVLPNQPPVPVISNIPGPRCSGSISASYSGANSYDPDGTITNYNWTSPGSPSSGSGVNFFTTITVPYPNNNCFTNASHSGPRLTVIDDRLASNSTTATITVGSKVACQGGCVISTSGPSQVSHGSTATISASISDVSVSGCSVPSSSITSSNPVVLQSPTCPGDTRTANFSGSNAYYGCGGSQTVQFGSKAAAPSFSISNQTTTNSNGSASFTATCGASSSAGISSQSISCSGSGVNVSSNSGTASFSLSASQGNSSSASCSCNATDNANPASCRQSNTASATFTYTNPSTGWNCNGDGTCSEVVGGTHSSKAACETEANCPTPPPPVSCNINLGCYPGGIQVGWSGVPDGGLTGQVVWNVMACSGDPGQSPRNGATPSFTVTAGSGNGGPSSNSPFQNPCAVCGQYLGFRPGDNPTVTSTTGNLSTCTVQWTGPFST